MKKMLCMLCAFITAFSVTGCTKRQADSIKVDFSRRDGTVVQNLKKIDMFGPCWDFLGDSPAFIDPAALYTLEGLNNLKSDNFRFDMMFGNGGIGDTIGKNGGDGSSDNEWALTNQFLTALNKNGLTPYMAMVGIPECAAAEGVYGYKPNLEKYYEFCYNVASYLKRNDVYAIVETWNEPDYLNSYWYDSMYDFVQTVVTANKAYHDANPFATVMQSGFCYPVEFIEKKVEEEDGIKTNWQRLWELTEQSGAMPDGFSWHFYGWGDGDLDGGLDETKRWSYWKNRVREALNSYAEGTAPELKGKKYDFRKLQQHVTEFNPTSGDIWRTCRQVWAFYDAITAVNAATDITRVAWSQFIADGFAVFKKDTYEVQPSYHVLWSYGRMPVDLVPVETDNERIGVMAGADSRRASFIVYNRSDVKEQNTDITFENLPAGIKSCDVYIIDQDNYDNVIYNKTPVLYKHIDKVKNGMKLELDVPPIGAYYVEFNTDYMGSELDQISTIGKLLKKEHYYPYRADNLPYTDVHNNSLTAYAGMADNATGESAAAVILDDMKKHTNLTFSYEIWGGAKESEKATIGVRVDYYTSAGFTKSVLLTVDGFAFDMNVPFGTEHAADIKLSLGCDKKGEYTFALAENAPEDWNGIVEISYLIKDAGNGATAKFTIHDKEGV